MPNNNADDSVEGNFKAVTTQIGKVFVNNEPFFDDVVNRFIDDAFDLGLQEAKQKLVLEDFRLNFEKMDKLKETLRLNHIAIIHSLLSSIEKDMGILLTTIDLNEIPFTNAAFKREIQFLFQKKMGQVETGIITEVNRAVGKGLIFGYEESGVVTHKQWVSVIDNRTTPICLHLNGEIVELGQPFSTGDYSEPAHFNCRSKVIPLTLTETQLERFRQ